MPPLAVLRLSDASHMISRCGLCFARLSEPSLRRFSVSTRDHLGTGGYGVTFKGVDSRNGMEVACKCVCLSEGSISLLRRLRREVGLLEKLAHPNIVKLYGAGMQGPSYVIVMELLHTDLYSIVKRSANGLSPRVALHYLTDVLRALAHCHRSGIVHRDVKLENAMLDDHGRVKLIDFGLALEVDREGQKEEEDLDHTDTMRSVAGSMPYIAPEVLSLCFIFRGSSL